MASGYVYIIKDIEVSGMFKIGYTNNPARRIYDFGVTLPFRTMVVMLIEWPDAPRLEKILHDTFANKRTNGEWFKLTDLDIAYAHKMLEYQSSLLKLSPDERAKVIEYCEQKLADKEAGQNPNG